MEPRKHELKNDLVLLVREAEKNDAPALLDHIRAIAAESDFLTFGPGEFEPTVAQERDVLRRFHESEGQIYLVGELDDRIVAALSFVAGHRPRTRHSGELGLSVRKPHWGLGIGASMLDAFLAWAGENHIVKVNLRVRTDNRRAMRLYERRGFVHEGTLRKEIYLDGRYYDLYWLGLDLSEAD